MGELTNESVENLFSVMLASLLLTTHRFAAPATRKPSNCLSR